jgi:5'-deoxynucleotidase YfbR-like HD superfamily hydrolase
MNMREIPNMRPDICTVNGKYFDFMSPETSEFDIHVIAHGLSNICRFAGHTKSFYSVAQHSVLVSLLVPQELALHGLLHDAAEAFIGDVARPLKNLLPDYREIEKRVEKAVFARFGLDAEVPESVKRADLILLATERRDLMTEHDDEWMVIKDVSPFPDTIMPQQPEIAYAMFIHRYRVIMGLDPVTGEAR